MLSQLHSRPKPKVECSGKINADSGSTLSNADKKTFKC